MVHGEIDGEEFHFHGEVSSVTWSVGTHLINSAELHQCSEFNYK